MELDSASASRPHVSSLYINALRHKIYLPLNMFTYDHLTTIGPNIKTEKITIPSDEFGKVFKEWFDACKEHSY